MAYKHRFKELRQIKRVSYHNIHSCGILLCAYLQAIADLQAGHDVLMVQTLKDRFSVVERQQYNWTSILHDTSFLIKNIHFFGLAAEWLLSLLEASQPL